MAAVIRASYFGGSAGEPAGASAEGGIKWNREDSQSGATTNVPVPTATGTNYSWLKNLALEVTTVANPVTSITNRRIAIAGAQLAGVTQHWKAAAYVQAAVGNMPGAAGTNDAVPSTYTLITTTPTVYDNNAASGGTLGRNGSMLQVVTGVSFLFTAGGGSAHALPNLQLTYDEA
jgi:hypothetical protein